MTWLITVNALELPPPLLTETTPLVYLQSCTMLFFYWTLDSGDRL